MQSIWLLSDCSAKEIRVIRSLCTPVDVAEGRTLVRQGEPSSQFVINARGTAVVSLDHRPVALIEAGSFFGDMALFGTGTHRATVTSATHMELLVFGQRESVALFRTEIPSVQEKIDTILAEREQALAELALHPEHAAPLDPLRPPGPATLSPPDEQLGLERHRGERTTETVVGYSRGHQRSQTRCPSSSLASRSERDRDAIQGPVALL